MAAHIENPIIKKILAHYRTIWSLNHLSALANWDLQTYMPPEGIHARGEALAKLSALSQSLFLDKSFINLIGAAEKESLSIHERAIIRMLKRSLKYYQKLPSDFLEKFAKVTTESHLTWKRAK